MKGLYTPHSWKPLEHFTARSVLRVRKCSSQSRNPPGSVLLQHFPISRPYLKTMTVHLPDLLAESLIHLFIIRGMGRLRGVHYQSPGGTQLLFASVC